MTQLLAKGDAPVALAPHLAGAKLFAATKKNGGIRPIAIGETLRRLTAKSLCHSTRDATKAHLWPLQVGCGSPLGAETAIHTLRQWRERNSQTEKVLLKIDFSNAFNCISRQVR